MRKGKVTKDVYEKDKCCGLLIQSECPKANSAPVRYTRQREREREREGERERER